MIIEKQPRQREQGFTLVELAIVMVIIGLLIGGILKGQELITNAQVAASVSQVKAFETAANTFRDSYQALAGDMANATNRLPNCASGSTCASLATAGNGRIDTALGAPPGNDERIRFFAQLSAADLISGVQVLAAVPATFWVAGDTLPAAEAGGVFAIGFANAVSDLPGELMDNTNFRASHYIGLNGTPVQFANNTGTLGPSQAQRIDDKMDDGNPLRGSVTAFGQVAAVPSGGGQCLGGATDTFYNTNNGGRCGLYFRVLQ